MLTIFANFPQLIVIKIKFYNRRTAHDVDCVAILLGIHSDYRDVIDSQFSYCEII